MAEEKKEQYKLELDIDEKLSEIQTRMNVPRDKYNKFGDYYYRSAESILEEFKKYSREYNVLLTIHDEITEIAGRVYVKAVAVFTDCKTGKKISVPGYAREPETKPKMDESQVTGSASSYARKYAMNALFLLDDVKDSDTDEYVKQTGAGEKKTSDQKKRIASKKEEIDAICSKHKLDAKLICSKNGYDYDKMTETQLENMIASLKKKFGDK